MVEYDNDYIRNFFDKLDCEIKKEVEFTEKSLDENIKKINEFLKNIDMEIKEAEETGDENLFNMLVNRKQLILQRLNDLQVITDRIKQ